MKYKKKQSISKLDGIKNKQIIILAGGFGTRLQSILNGLPKPLADINGTPFLKYLLKNLVAHGFNDFIFSLHYSANKIIEFIKEQQKGLLKNLKVQYVVENKPLGTGGAISYVVSKKLTSEIFFVTNADTWIQKGYLEIDFEKGNVIGLVEIENTDRYGKVELSNNLVSNFLEKESSTEKGYVNVGTYKLSKKLFLKWEGNSYSLEKDLFPQLAKINKLKAVVIETNFIDIGVPNDYNKFCNLNK